MREDNSTVKGLPHDGEFVILQQLSNRGKNRNSVSWPHDCDHYSRTSRVYGSHMTEANEIARLVSYLVPISSQTVIRNRAWGLCS